jgi:hypothetical protein
MADNPIGRYWPTSGQARKGSRMGHPELSIECPRCHSAIGRTCFMEPRAMGITHTIRKIRYQERRAAEAASIAPC